MKQTAAPHDDAAWARRYRRGATAVTGVSIGAIWLVGWLSDELDTIGLVGLAAYSLALLVLLGVGLRASRLFG